MGGAATSSPLPKPHTHQTSPPHTPAARRRSNRFPEGAVVEVRPTEPDFRDTYFSATVISPVLDSTKKGSNKNPRKITVEYHNLFEKEDGSTPLKERLSIQCLRPSPPPQEVVEGFEPGDAVDAFYQEGWWIGVVERVVEGEERRYAVTFQNPPDELEFGLSELRVHWDWVDGDWFRFVRQSTSGLMFDVGRKVEVSFDQQNLLGVWYPGTIHQHLTIGTYLVECCCPHSDKATKTEIVDFRHVRPCPPLLKHKNFILLEKVDAFYDFGWWTGTVTQEFENNRYLVFFKQLNMEKEFNQSELRSHIYWKDGKWFTSSQVLLTPSFTDGHENLAYKTPIASVLIGPVSNLGDEKDTFDGNTSDLVDVLPKFQKTPHLTSLTKRRQHLSDSQIGLSQAQNNLKEGNALGANQQDEHDNSIKEMTDTLEKQCAPVGHSSDNLSRGKRTQNVGGKINSSSNARNISASTSQVEIMDLDVQGKESDVVDKMAAVQNEHIKTGTEVIIGLPCSPMLSPGFKSLRGKMECYSNREISSIGSEAKQQLHDCTTKKIENIKLSEIVDSEKRKRGRPRKRTESIQIVSDYLNEKDDDRIIPEVVAIDMETPPSSNQEKKTLNKDKAINGGSNTKDRKRASTRKREEKVVEESINPQENHLPKKGRRHSTILQVQDLIDASGGKSAEVNSTLEVNIVCDATSHEFENEPLSKWVEGMHILSAVDVSKPSPMSAMEQPIENREKNQKDIAVLEVVSEMHPESEVLIPTMAIEKHQESEVPIATIVTEKHQESEVPIPTMVTENHQESEVSIPTMVTEKHQESEVSIPTMVDKYSVVLMEPPNLPFVKKSLLWKILEAMDALQRIPQNPHFQPLEHIKESLREGKAIGYMVTFVSVVGKIYELQFGDPKSVTDDILEALAELEMHGFNVRPVQDRVAELLAAKEKEVNLVGDVKELNDRILERHLVKDKIEEEIDGIKDEIRKLEEKLAVAESAKGKEVGEIAALEGRLKETEENIEKVRHDFEGIVSSAV